MRTRVVWERACVHVHLIEARQCPKPCNMLYESVCVRVRAFACVMAVAVVVAGAACFLARCVVVKAIAHARQPQCEPTDAFATGCVIEHRADQRHINCVGV